MTDGVRLLAGERPIAGVEVVPLRRIPDERGSILHMLRKTDPHFREFGEIYFSTLYAGAIKGWHWHREMTLNYACILGRVKLVLFDDREGSTSRSSLMEIYLGPDSYNLVVIPPELWSGMKGMSEPFAMIANCATHPHDPKRSERIAPTDARVPYDWSRKDE